MGALRSIRLAFAAVCLVPALVLGCSGGGASYADRSGVEAAEAEWCKAVTKIRGGDLAACKSTYPSASGAYLRGMTKCYPKRIADAGDKAPDDTMIISDCNEEVFVAMTSDDAQYGEIIGAYCGRKAKCEKAVVAECKDGIAKMMSAERAKLTSQYNAAALHRIADCLDSTSCSDDEDKTVEGCYKAEASKLLWFPG